MSNAKSCEIGEKVTFQENPKDIVKQYDNVFHGLGKLPDKVKIEVDPSVPPRICANRKIPVSLESRVKEELQRMERENVIIKQNDPTDWVSNMVIIEKPNKKLRLCIDPIFLNSAIKRSHFPFPELDSMKAKLEGASHFTVLDAASGFWQLELDEDSKKLCTFTTPFGRFSYCRLPFGVKSSPEIFLQVMQKYFGDMENVQIWMDDFLIYGDDKTHAVALKRVLQKAQEIGLKFNLEKSKIDQESVKYCGHVFSKNGISVDPDKVTAIDNLEFPKDVPELQRVLGMLNYLREYIPNFSNYTENMRQLLKKNVTFNFTEAMKKDFNELKTVLKNNASLAFYDRNAKVTLSVDSSSYAIGCCLMQKGRPVAYASAALTACQSRYSQIEKEMLAIVFGCKKFHTYLYGRSVDVESDHKPLESIFTKSLVQISPRLQRLLLKVQGYDLKVRWVPGKFLYVADTLSRSNCSLQPELNEMDNELAIQVNLLTNNLAISPERIEEIRENAKSDKALVYLQQYLKEGWPKCKSKVAKEAQPYWNVRGELFGTSDGLVFKGSALVIPAGMRTSIMKKIHAQHAGVTRTLSLAKQVVYWPFMAHELRTFLENCQVCLTYSTAQRAEPLIPHSVGTYPFEKVAVDFFKFNKKKYLVVVDYYSCYPEIQLMNSTNATSTIVHLKSIFARHGIPRELVSDGGPPFTSAEMKEFGMEWDIKLTQSSPYHAASNGLVESTVKNLKSMFKKCEDPYEGLLMYRNTPRDTLAAPAELLMSRKLRTVLPTLEKNLRPKIVPVREHLRKTEERKGKMKKWFDRGTRELCNIPINADVHVQLKPNSPFVKGKVVHCCKEPRTYIVQCSTGVYKRNRKFIKYNPNTDSECIPNKPKPILQQNPKSVIPSARMYVTVGQPRSSEDNLDESEEFLSESESSSLTSARSTLKDDQGDEESSLASGIGESTSECENSLNATDNAHGQEIGASPPLPHLPSEDEDEEVSELDDNNADRPVRERRPVKRFTFSDF